MAVRAQPGRAAAKWRMPPDAADQLPTGLEAAGDEPRVVSRGDHTIGSFAVIRFAEPIESPEAAFAAVLTGEAMLGTARYFLWELTAAEAGAGGPAALLCEWLHDGTRRNHGRSGNAASEADFVAAVKAQLDTEQERRRAGAPAVHAPARRPGETRDPVDFLIAEAEGAAFRHQHCLMAFDVLPASAKADERAWLHAIEASDFTSLLSNLWRRAGEQAADQGHRADLPAEGLAADAARIAGAACAMVTLPRAFSPPEAYFVAVFPGGFGSGSADDGRSPVVYTLEMTDPLGRTPPVVGRVDADGDHALIGDCDVPTRAAFVQALTSVAAGKSLPQGMTTLRQLLLHTKVGADRRP
jgi:hypothetical protein